jgi:hypothetical protein
VGVKYKYTRLPEYSTFEISGRWKNNLFMNRVDLVSLSRHFQLVNAVETLLLDVNIASLHHNSRH